MKFKLPHSPTAIAHSIAERTVVWYNDRLGKVFIRREGEDKDRVLDSGRLLGVSTSEDGMHVALVGKGRTVRVYRIRRGEPELLTSFLTVYYIERLVPYVSNGKLFLLAKSSAGYCLRLDEYGLVREQYLNCTGVTYTASKSQKPVVVLEDKVIVGPYVHKIDVSNGWKLFAGHSCVLAKQADGNDGKARVRLYRPSLEKLFMWEYEVDSASAVTCVDSRLIEHKSSRDELVVHLGPYKYSYIRGSKLRFGVLSDKKEKKSVLTFCTQRMKICETVIVGSF